MPPSTTSTFIPQSAPPAPHDETGPAAGAYMPMTRGALERVPKCLNLIPTILQWLWLSLRYRSVSLPSSANPAITSGGLVGEGKLEYFNSMGPIALAATVTTTSLINEGPASFAAAEAAMAAAGLGYPLICKPDLGWCGFGVRIVRDAHELRDYLARFPVGECIVMQRFLDDAGEAGLFYMRHPDEPRGRLTGLLLRHFPRVIGDGRHTVAQLMAADPRLQRLGADGLSEPCCDTARIPAAGEVCRVSTIGSTRVGGLYLDGTALITPALSAAVDAISRDMRDFHVGRFDVKFESLATLREGKGFKIIEVNGSGADAVQAFDPAHSWRQAYRIIFEKQRELFAISHAMRQRGHKPIGLIGLAKLHFRQQRLIKLYPPSN